jgi:serine/threonine protein kinase
MDESSAKSCPDPRLLERYRTGQCSREEGEVVLTHIAECRICSAMVSGESTKAGPATIPSPPDDDRKSSGSMQPPEVSIEGYKIVRELDQGGQAMVYEAIHLATKTKVALKVLPATRAASTKARRYFEREAELIAYLDHPNIVKIRENGTAHGGHFFAMEYIHGKPLDVYVSEKDLPFRNRVELFVKICDAMVYAHQHGVIHRDLKPGNILVDERGEPHVLDFGLAKIAGFLTRPGESIMPTMTGQLMGSMVTMSPEQAGGRPELIDMRTDIYSLGVILYHMLLGRYPYDVYGATAQVLRNIQEEEPVRPRTIDRKFSPEVEAIIFKAIAKDPRKRYQSCTELKSDIERWLSGLPISVNSLNTVYVLRKIVARHRYAAAVLGLLIIIVLGFAGASGNMWWAARNVSSENDALKTQLASLSQEKDEYTRLISFGSFLEAWHAGQMGQAQLAALFLAEGSKEKRAVRFLLDDSPLAEKESDFRKLSDSDPAFVAFVLGEYYLKNGKNEEALKQYNEGRRYISGDGKNGRISNSTWLAAQLQARISELSSRSEPQRSVSAIPKAVQEDANASQK